MLRSIAVVLGGFIVMAVVVMIGTAASAAALIPGGVASMRAGRTEPLPGRYLAANLLVSFLAAVVAGWFVARYAPGQPDIHAAALALVVLVIGAISAMMTPRSGGTQPGQPGWYQWVIPIVGVAGVAVGCLLRMR